VCVLQARRFKELDTEDDSPYEYDAFVVYSEHDSKWVKQQLCPKLEDAYKLKLCLHYRDFPYGQEIMTNITTSIEKSRKCLLIASNAFATSNWCHFEMSMAQTGMLRKDRHNVILVLLEEINEFNMTPRLCHQMSKYTYPEWTESEVGQQLFWKRLCQALAKPAVSVVSADVPNSEFMGQQNQHVDQV